MATTNNDHEDEPRPSARERQVQTLATTVERLTKQNQILEEQLHRKAGHGAQEEDQEDTRLPVPSDEIKRDWRVVTPQANWSDKM